MENDIISPLIQAVLEVVIQALLPVLLGFVVLGVKRLTDSIKVKMAQDEIELVMSLADAFVKAAEQNGLAGAIINEGQAKKRWVKERLGAELSARGIHLDLDTLDDMIERAVFDALWEPKPSP